MKKLKKLRINANLTQKQLADKIENITCQSISNYEKGKREPSFDILQKLAQFFDCTIDELM